MINEIIKGVILGVYLSILFISMCILDPPDTVLIFTIGLPIALGIMFIDYEYRYNHYKERREKRKMNKIWAAQSKTVIKFVEDYVNNK
jgi:hypothetical protein